MTAGTLRAILLLVGFISCKSGRAADSFVRFQVDPAWSTTDEIIKAYASWHNTTLANKELTCNDLQGMTLAVEEGGIGYTANLIFPLFLAAVETGRLFFVDWPHPWRPVFQGPDFDWDFSENISADRICLHSDMVRVRGDYCRKSHPISTWEVVNRGLSWALDRPATMSYLLRPSREVLEIMSPVMLTRKQSNLVAVAIRTGRHDYQRFLKDGDESVFLQCVASWFHGRLHGNDLPVTVFLTSDDEKVKSRAKLRLEAEGMNVISLKDSYIHTAHDVAETDADVITRVQKTVAEFWLISESHFAFLTESSLFGFIAVEMGGLPSDKKFFISSSDCDSPDRGYIRCAVPRYPPFCFGEKKQLFRDEL